MKHFKIVGFIASCVMTMSAHAIVLKGDVGNGGGEDDQSSGGIGIAYQFTEQRVRMFNQPEIFLRTNEGRYGNYLGYSNEMPLSEAGAEFAFYNLVEASTYPLNAEFTHTEVIDIQAISRSLADSNAAVCEGPESGNGPHDQDPPRESCGANSTGNDADSRAPSAVSERETVTVSGASDPDRTVRVTSDYLVGGSSVLTAGGYYASPDMRVQVASNARSDAKALRLSDIGISAGFRVWDMAYQEALDNEEEALAQIDSASMLNADFRRIKIDWNDVDGDATRLEDLGGQIEVTLTIKLLDSGIATDTYLVMQTMEIVFVPEDDDGFGIYNSDTKPSVSMSSNNYRSFSGSIGLYSQDSQHPIWAYVDESVPGDPVNDANGKYASFNPFDTESLYLDPVIGLLAWVERDSQGRGIVYSTHRARSDFSCHPPNRPNAPMATIVPLVDNRSDEQKYLSPGEVPNALYIRIYSPGMDGICPALRQDEDPEIIIIDGPDDGDGGDQGGGDVDSDDDTIHDENDNCPLTPNPAQEDFDGDGRGDACDNDIDGDGITNGTDNCPAIPNPNQADVDGDGIGDVCDDFTDSDGDGIEDANDNCPFTANPNQSDQDGDGIGDVCDSDNDNDGIPDDTDNCPAVPNPGQADQDGDGIGDACDTLNDTDRDGIEDDVDNCPLTPNANQADADGDGIGDACDDDADNDGIPNGQDNCVNTPNPDQADSDNDGIGDVCDNFNDGDGDGHSDGEDNCPAVSNPGQSDMDGDGIGDACDPDIDGDGVTNSEDNCRVTPNPGQEDSDGDGIGDVCDPDTSYDPFDYSCTEPPAWAIEPPDQGDFEGTDGDDFMLVREGSPVENFTSIITGAGRDKVCIYETSYGGLSLGDGEKDIYVRVTNPPDPNVGVESFRIREGLEPVKTAPSSYAAVQSKVYGNIVGVHPAAYVQVHHGDGAHSLDEYPSSSSHCAKSRGDVFIFEGNATIIVRASDCVDDSFFDYREVPIIFAAHGYLSAGSRLTLRGNNIPYAKIDTSVDAGIVDIYVLFYLTQHSGVNGAGLIETESSGVIDFNRVFGSGGGKAIRVECGFESGRSAFVDLFNEEDDIAATGFCNTGGPKPRGVDRTPTREEFFGP